MEEFKNLKDLDISLDDLYQGKKQINIHLSDKSYTFHVVMRDSRGPDCKISSWGANLWARTNRGMEFKRYNAMRDLQRELVKLIKRKVDTEGEITFSLSNEVFTI